MDQTFGSIFPPAELEVSQCKAMQQARLSHEAQGCLSQSSGDRELFSCSALLPAGHGVPGAAPTRGVKDTHDALQNYPSPY